MDEVAECLIAPCPEVTVKLSGVPVQCILDTGSMVSTISEGFFKKHFPDKLKACHWLELRAANGLSIPYLGYLEPDIEVCGVVIPRRGILVVRDPPCQAKLPQVPGIIGMNIIKARYLQLFDQYGPDLFKLPSVLGAPTSWLPAFQLCQQVESQKDQIQTSVAKLRGRRPVVVPAGTTKFVPATCSAMLTQAGGALIEPLDRKFGLPEGLLVSPSLLQVFRGTVYVPVVNVGVCTVSLKPCCALGVVSPVEVVSLPSELQEVPCVQEQVVAAVRSHTAQTGSVGEKITSLNLSMLDREEQHKVRALLLKYEAVFSAFDGDLGVTNLIEHTIPLLDTVPVRQRYRRIPPSEYEAVKSHINQLLATQVIRESSSPYASPIVLVRKKDGSLRLCVDYRQLNKKTRKDAFALPRIEETLDSLSGARWFTTMDLACGYNQVPVAENDRPKTAFCTPFGLFEFN